MRYKVLLLHIVLFFVVFSLSQLEKAQATWGNPPNLHMTCPNIFPAQQSIAQIMARLYAERPATSPNPPHWWWYRCDEFNDGNGTAGSCINPTGQFGSLWKPYPPPPVNGDPVGFITNVYNQLNGISPRTYTLTADAEWCVEEDSGTPDHCFRSPPIANYRSGTATCQVTLQCQNSCTAPEDIGGCSSQCDIEVAGSYGCVQGGQEGSFNLIPPSEENFTINWGDGFQSIGSGSAQHTYLNAGVYDIQLKKGSSVCCVRRLNATCNAPGSLPTSTPAPTPACAPGLQCMHPCACNSGSQQYADAGCGGGVGGIGGGNTGTGGTGTSTGTNVGGLCGPGLICCEPAAQSGEPWLKVKDASLHSSANIDMPIPTQAAPYDGDDVGLCSLGKLGSLSCLNINEPGVITVQGTLTTGDGTISHREWNRQDEAYNMQRLLTPSAFLTYVQTRKTYHVPTDILDIQSNTINVMSGSIGINESNLQGKNNVVLIVDGDVSISALGTFNATSTPLVIMATGMINIRSTVTEMNGIFIAKDVDFAIEVAEGSTTENPLKIKGNLISYTPSDCTEKRQRPDNRSQQPSCFIVFDPVGHYLPLAHMLSVRSYEWSALTP